MRPDSGPGSSLSPRVWWRAIRDDPGITGDALLVALLISTTARSDGTRAVMSNQALVDDTGLSLATVKRRVREVREAGWLVLVERGRRLGNGSTTANAYALTHPVDNPVSTGHPGDLFKQGSTAHTRQVQAGSTAHPGEPLLGDYVPPVRARAHTREAPTTARCSRGFVIAADNACCPEHREETQA
jgi:hypothetical protein